MPTVAVAERFGYTRRMPGPISQDRAAPSAASWRGRDTFAAAAYNLVRLRTLLAGASP